MNLLSRYTLLERLGNSVLGTTYKAQDTSTGSFVSLRLLQLGLLDEASRRDFETRVQRAFETGDRLTHPGIARVFEIRREGHTALIASELVDGPTITSFVRASGGSELSQVVTAVGQMLEALDYAHRQSVIHRDLRPTNVRLQGERIKVTDFAMADLGSGAREDGAPHDRTEYMAPEQFGTGAIDKRCDIHAAGAILYELLTGRSPFAGEADGLTAVFRVLNFLPPPPSQVRPGLAPAFDRVVQRALAKSPAERFATAEQFRDELRSAYSALMRRPPPDTLVRSVFASQMPPAPAARPSGGDASLTSPLPEQLFMDKAAARAAEAAPRSAPEKAAAPARAATPVPPDAPLPGSTLPGTRSAAPPPAPGAREVTSRSLRADAPARGDAQKGNGRLEPPKVSESAPPAKESGARSTPTRLEGAPARTPEPASPPSDLKDLISAAIPVPPLTSQGARAKEPGKPAPVSGGTVLAPPKRPAAAAVEPAPAKEAKKDEPAPGGTVLAPAKRAASEQEKARPVPGGTRLPPPRGAASESVAEDLVGQAIPVESVLASQPTAPEPPAARAAAAEAAAPPAQEAPGQPSAEDELSETQQAKKFERTIWIPTPKDDSGLWRGPPPPKSPAPASPSPEVTEDESVVSAPPPKAPVPKKVVPLTDAAIAHGGKVLARFMGPIAMVLSRRAAQDLKDEKAFFDALASHLTDPDERYQFLREVRQRPG